MAKEPSRYVFGTDTIASKDMLIIVGKIITPSTMDVERSEKPEPPK
jgi:hypothetical protein